MHNIYAALGLIFISMKFVLWFYILAVLVYKTDSDVGAELNHQKLHNKNIY